MKSDIFKKVHPFFQKINWKLFRENVDIFKKSTPQKTENTLQLC